jgi:hypothetical protein
MEASRYLIALVIAGLAIACMVPAATAYLNALSTDPHPAINEVAIQRVESWMASPQADPYLKKVTFSSGVVEGCDSPHHALCDSWAEKSLRDWIIYGGYSADTDDSVVLSHGYDPVSGRGWDGVMYGSYQPATDWTAGTGNPYSFTRAKSYLETAMAAPTASNGISAYAESGYGNAWRSAGESMHMVSDMTMPSHVWIDRHPYGDSDPFESSLTRNSVFEVRDMPFSPSVDYDSILATGDITRLMKDLAAWTHANFYSEDAIPDLQPGREGYVYMTVDGEQVPAARMSLLSFAAANHGSGRAVPVYTVADRTILSAQKERVIPAAIQGSARTLFAFLPRFEARVDRIVYNPAYGDPRSGQTVIQGTLVHHPTPVWPSEPAVGNGAFIRVNDNPPIRVLPSANGGSADLSEITCIVPAVPGDRVTLFYDFGGFVISSGQVTVPAAAATTRPTAVVTTDDGMEYSENGACARPRGSSLGWICG